MRVSIPLPRRCERRTLPIELIAHICEVKVYLHVYDWLAEWSKALVLGTSQSSETVGYRGPHISHFCF